MVPQKMEFEVLMLDEKQEPFIARMVLETDFIEDAMEGVDGATQISYKGEEYFIVAPYEAVKHFLNIRDTNAVGSFKAFIAEFFMPTQN